jgi:hypothetical protein
MAPGHFSCERSRYGNRRGHDHDRLHAEHEGQRHRHYGTQPQLKAPLVTAPLAMRRCQQPQKSTDGLCFRARPVTVFTCSSSRSFESRSHPRRRWHNNGEGTFRFHLAYAKRKWIWVALRNYSAPKRGWIKTNTCRQFKACGVKPRSARQRGRGRGRRHRSSRFRKRGRPRAR